MRSKKTIHWRAEFRTAEHGWYWLNSTAHAYKKAAYNELKKYMKTHSEVVAARIVKQTTLLELNETIK